MNFEAYLISKKIDPAAFRNAEPAVWKSWNELFAEMHPNSFTLQKLNLINPIRRKYQLKEPVPVVPFEKITTAENSAAQNTAPSATPASLSPPAAATATPASTTPASKPARPVMKPKPKIG